MRLFDWAATMVAIRPVRKRIRLARFAKAIPDPVPSGQRPPRPGHLFQHLAAIDGADTPSYDDIGYAVLVPVRVTML